MKTRIALSFSVALLSACSGTVNGSDTGGGGGGGGGGDGNGSAHAPLFEAPTGEATPDSIYGLWGGTTTDKTITFDSRIQLAESTMTFATRCSASDGTESSIVGVTVAARVDETEIAVLESKKDERTTGELTCRASARPSTTKRCDPKAAFQKECFELEGKQLTLYGASPIEKVVMTKLSD